MVQQHAKRDVGVPRLQERFADVRGACEAGADFEGVQAHDIGEAGAGEGELRGC